jgi:hypothetical protein
MESTKSCGIMSVTFDTARINLKVILGMKGSEDIIILPILIK